MINKKFYIDYLSQQTKEDGRPYETALSDFCDYLLDLFSVKAFDGTLDGFKNWQQQRLQAKPKFGVLAMVWLNDVSQAMDRGQWLDVFGMLYEDMYLTAGKASKTGQFFTPQSVSDLMSSIIGSGKNEATSAKIEGTTVNDCAAGSGRLLLAHFIEAEPFSRENIPVCCSRLGPAGMQNVRPKHDGARNERTGNLPGYPGDEYTIC